MPGALWTGALSYQDAQGSLTINSVAMCCPAWTVLDLLPLYLHGGTRGANVVLPGASGKRAYPRRIDEATFDLPMLITGSVDRLGNPNAHQWEGLQTNLAYLASNVVNPPAAPTATVSATLTVASGATRTANIQVVALELGNLYTRSGIVRGVLSIIVPSGRFV